MHSIALSTVKKPALWTETKIAENEFTVQDIVEKFQSERREYFFGLTCLDCY